MKGTKGGKPDPKSKPPAPEKVEEQTPPEASEDISETPKPHGAPAPHHEVEMPTVVKGEPPLQISAEEIELPERAVMVRKPYWVGLKPRGNADGSTGLPFFHWSAGGVTFAFKQGPIVNDVYSGEAGGVVHLTDEQLEAVVAQVKRTVCRPVGPTSRTLEVDHPRYVRDDRDVPMACFCYIYPLDPTNVHNRPTLDPVPLMAEWN